MIKKTKETNRPLLEENRTTDNPDGRSVNKSVLAPTTVKSIAPLVAPFYLGDAHLVTICRAAQGTQFLNLGCGRCHESRQAVREFRRILLHFEKLIYPACVPYWQ